MLFTLRSLSESRFGKNNLATAVDNRLLWGIERKVYFVEGRKCV